MTPEELNNYSESMIRAKSRMNEIQALWREGGTIIPQDVHWLINQTTHALDVEAAFNRIVDASKKLITELNVEIFKKDIQISELSGGATK